MKKMVFMLIAVGLLAVSCKKDDVDLAVPMSGTKWTYDIKEEVYEWEIHIKTTFHFVDSKNVEITSEVIKGTPDMGELETLKGTYIYDGKTQSGVMSFTGFDGDLSFTVNGDKLIAVEDDGETVVMTRVK